LTLLAQPFQQHGGLYERVAGVAYVLALPPRAGLAWRCVAGALAIAARIRFKSVIVVRLLAPDCAGRHCALAFHVSIEYDAGNGAQAGVAASDAIVT
jgi:hypothetical protein